MRILCKILCEYTSPKGSKSKEVRWTFFFLRDKREVPFHLWLWLPLQQQRGIVAAYHSKTERAFRVWRQQAWQDQLNHTVIT
jgi:hypothetical protein